MFGTSPVKRCTLCSNDLPDFRAERKWNSQTIQSDDNVFSFIAAFRPFALWTIPLKRPRTYYLSYLGFGCWDEHCNQKQLGEEKVHVVTRPYHSSSLKAAVDRNPKRARSWRQELMERVRTSGAH